MSEPRIVSTPGVMLGKPVIAGTRITEDDVRAALAFAVSVVPMSSSLL